MFERRVTAAKEARAPPREWPKLVSLNPPKGSARLEGTCADEMVVRVGRVLVLHYGNHGVCDGVERSQETPVYRGGVVGWHHARRRERSQDHSGVCFKVSRVSNL